MRMSSVMQSKLQQNSWIPHALVDILDYQLVLEYYIVGLIAFWSGVAETPWFFPFPSRLHIHAGVLQRAASWREKRWANTQVGRGESFDPPEYRCVSTSGKHGRRHY